MATTSTNHKSNHKRHGGSLSPINTSGQCSYQNTSSSSRRGVTISPSFNQRRGGSLSPILFSPSSDDRRFIHDPVVTRRSQSAIPPPLVMDTHPMLRKLSNLHHKQNHFNSMPDFQQSRTSTLCSPSHSRTSLSPPPPSPLEEGIYSRLNHSLLSPPVDPQPSPYLIQGYSQLNIVQDSTPPPPSDISDGYTYIDIDAIKRSTTQKKEQREEESTDLPGHHYFVLEIPPDDDRTDSPQDGTDAYLYVDVNRSIFSSPMRSPSPSSTIGRQVSEYEQPVNTLNRKAYKPITLGTHKRIGVAKPHPSHQRADGYSTLPHNWSSTCKSSMFPLLSPSSVSPTSPRTSPVPPPACISPTSPRTPSYQRGPSSRRISPTSPHLVTRHTSPCISPTPNHFFGKRSPSVPYPSSTQGPPKESKRSVTPLQTVSSCGTMSHDNHVTLIITEDGPVLSTRRRSSTNPESITHVQQLATKTNNN